MSLMSWTSHGVPGFPLGYYQATAHVSTRQKSSQGAAVLGDRSAWAARALAAVAVAASLWHGHGPEPARGCGWPCEDPSLRCARPCWAALEASRKAGAVSSD